LPNQLQCTNYKILIVNSRKQEKKRPLLVIGQKADHKHDRRALLSSCFHLLDFLWHGGQGKMKNGLTTFPHEECIDSIALSRTYKSTALSSGRVEVKLKPKSIRTYKQSIWLL